MADFLAIVTTAIETVKKLRAVAEKIKDAETKNLIADLQLQLADIKAMAAELKEEKMTLQQQLKSAIERKSFAKKLIHRNGLYWLESPKPGENPGPFCPNCSTEDRPYAVQEEAIKAFGKYHCTKCNGFFK